MLDWAFTPRQIGYHEKRWGLDKCRVDIGNKRILYRMRQVAIIIRGMDL